MKTRCNIPDIARKQKKIFLFSETERGLRCINIYQLKIINIHTNKGSSNICMWYRQRHDIQGVKSEMQSGMLYIECK